MLRLLFPLALLLLTSSCGSSQKTIATNSTNDPIGDLVNNLEAQQGYFPFWWDEKKGKIWMRIDQLDQPFLYVNALSAGLGSNDIGLDRGQLGGERIVRFVRSGEKLLLIQPNLKFRAISDNPDERRSVEEAFAQSVLWGFPIAAEKGQQFLIDLSPFLLRDAHGVAASLKNSDQGLYKLAPSRSSLYRAGCKNFPQNTELEALLTFLGDGQGKYVQQVAPDPEALSVRMHHSFIQLPDDNYQTRPLDPRSGFFGISYSDYATPIDQPLVKRFLQRHRLEKKDPTASISEAVEPIVYYLDRGAPEPIKSALLEGASWWNQAFEAAGYRNAFQVKILPEGVDPLDIRYNVIQWVHRSTRGWSYGSTVTDPRTGEIIKGHVSLGSLRVRQDFLIAQGLIAAYEAGKAPKGEMLEMALARLRQLSAHEVGHTLGLAHNFAASGKDRASVMDYPHPYITLTDDEQLDFSRAYDDKIGAWDKRAILYGYQDFPSGTDEAVALRAILAETIAQGHEYLSDEVARPLGGAHPLAHLWDNGQDPVTELERLLAVRAVALKNFSEANIPEHQPLATLEEVLVPLYLSHRYQVEAVAKLIGGVQYRYANRGDGQEAVKIVAAAEQEKALQILLQTMQPEVLALPPDILKLIPPKPIGYARSRESFGSRTGPTLDPIYIAEGMVQHHLNLLLHPARANRLVEQEARDTQQKGFQQYLQDLVNASWQKENPKPYHASIQRATAQLLLQQILELSQHEKASNEVKAICMLQIARLAQRLAAKEKTASGIWQAHYHYALQIIDRYHLDPQAWEAQAGPKLPDGSPIGCGH